MRDVWWLAVGQLWRRRGRSMAVVASIVVTAVSFSLLSASVATSRLEVRGTVTANFRTAYDILVRPPGSRTALERSQQLVRENYLSGIFGGITMRQYQTIKALRGVQVAAPIAMVGYLVPSLFLKERITDLVTTEKFQLFRLRQTWVSDRGLSRYPSRDKYVYVTRQPVRHGWGFVERNPITGGPINVCRSWERNSSPPRSPFDNLRLTQLSCYSTNPPGPSGFLASGQVGTGIQYPFPMLLAAVDPRAEAALVGLDQAVTAGRYLKPGEGPRMRCVGCGSQNSSGDSLKYRRLPVLMPDRPLVDERLRITWQRIDLPDPRRLPGRLASQNVRRWLSSLSGESVRTKVFRPGPMYARLLRFYAANRPQGKTQYWSSGQVDYRRRVDGHLQPVVKDNPPDTWLEPYYPEKYFAPAASADKAFRTLGVHVGYTTISEDNVFASPAFRRVGTVDPKLIKGFSPLSEVPLTTYYAPTATPGDPRSNRLLSGRPLAPNGNLAGYLQQPPLMITTLGALGPLTSQGAFSGTTEDRRAPISVVRVRVAGVTGADKLSMARIRLVAERIVRSTGLDVDVTIGSSPTPALIDLPAGDFGRPPLTLREGWVKKGASVKLLAAIDRKSAGLFGLVLGVCLLFVGNATLAGVRSRRTELGVLSCLGWPPRRIFGLLQAELFVTGLVAGLVGTSMAVAVTVLLDLRLALWQLAGITPVATILAVLAGIWPAWRACRAHPLEAITPAVRAPRRAARVGSLTELAWAGVARWPGRTLLAATSLLVGVGALAVLIAIQTAFQGEAAGTLLGDFVAVQVRAVDYLAAGVTIALGAFAVADVSYLSMTERIAEIGAMRASGWTERHLRRLFVTEAAMTAGMGAALGALLGVAAVAVLFRVDVQTSLVAAAVSAATGMAVALLALVLPLQRLSRMSPATALASE